MMRAFLALCFAYPSTLMAHEKSLNYNLILSLLQSLVSLFQPSLTTSGENESRRKQKQGEDEKERVTKMEREKRN